MSYLNSYIKQLDFAMLSKLPTEEQLLQKCSELNIKALPLVKSDNVMLLDDEKISIEDFIQLAKTNSGILYYSILTFEDSACLITGDDLLEKDGIVQKVVNILTCDTIEELASALDQHNANLFTEEESTSSIPTILDYFSYLNKEEENETDISVEELGGVGVALLELFTQYNNSVPHNCSSYTKIIRLGTIIDGNLVSIIPSNEDIVNIDLVIAELVSPYLETDYDKCLSKIQTEKLEKELQATKRKNELINELKEALKVDAKFRGCTNQQLRHQFVGDMKDNPIYNGILEELSEDYGFLVRDIYLMLDTIYKQIK